MNAREFEDKILQSNVALYAGATVEVRYRIGGETIQLPVSAVFMQESAGGGKQTLVIEAATRR